MGFWEKISKWFNERLGLEELPFFRTPDYMYKVDYWLGALVASAFIYTVISGLVLLLYYNYNQGFNSTMFIINEAPYGSALLFSHLYGAYAMILLAYIHMFRNYFSGAYKRPRELVWIIGVFMLVLTLGTSFLGYSLIGDALAVNAVEVGSGLITSIPQLSPLVAVFFGNYTVGDFSRVLAWHIILTAFLGVLFLFHFFLAETYGIMPSRKVKDKVPAVYSKDEWLKFNKWWPRNFIYMTSLMFFTWGFILFIPNALAYLNNLPPQLEPFLQPRPGPSPTSPLASTITPYPPWFFLFLYKIADFSNDIAVFLSIGVIIPILYLILVPFLDKGKELHPLRRKIFTVFGILMITYLIQTTVWGDLAPGVQVSIEEQIIAYLPPLLITSIGVWLIKPKGEVGGGNKSQKASTGPFMILVFVIISLLLASEFYKLITEFNLFTMSVFLAVSLVFYKMAKKLKPVALKDIGSPNFQEGTLPSEPEWKKKLAEALIAMLFILSFTIAFNIWTIPSTGYESTLFGVDLGLVFIMLGEAISLYHYVVYRK